MTATKSLILIADYGVDSLATTEAILAVRRRTTIPFSADTVASRPFNTLHTGFLADQLQRGFPQGEGRNTVFYLNTDPRTQTTEATIAAAGSSLVVAELRNGAIIVTPNAGYCLSYVKGSIIRLAEINVAAAGSQFRSRDIFPIAVAHALSETLAGITGKELSIDTIPDPPKAFTVLHIDNYGNIKTSFTHRAFEAGGMVWGGAVRVRLAGVTMDATVSPTIFGSIPGKLVLAPGSSGDQENPFFELSIRYDGDCRISAGSSFGWPEPGSVLEIN